MPKTYTEQEILTILSWRKLNNAPLRQTSKQFGISTTTLQSWEKNPDYAIEKLTAKYKGEVNYNTGEVHVKNILPEDVEKAINDATTGLSEVTLKASKVLMKWLDGIIDKQRSHMVIKPAEISLVIKAMEKASPYVVAQKTISTGDPASSGISEIEKARQDIEARLKVAVAKENIKASQQKAN